MHFIYFLNKIKSMMERQINENQDAPTFKKSLLQSKSCCSTHIPCANPCDHALQKIAFK